MVFHGGAVVDPVASDVAAKQADLVTLRASLDAVSRQHFPGLSNGRLAVRLVACPSLCSDAIAVLNSIWPGDSEPPLAFPFLFSIPCRPDYWCPESVPCVGATTHQPWNPILYVCRLIKKERG